jgi:hypothetical protein
MGRKSVPTLTPAMIAAGRLALSEYDARFEGPTEAVRAIYEAMALARDAETVPAPKKARPSCGVSASAASRKAAPNKSGRKA